MTGAQPYLETVEQSTQTLKPNRRRPSGIILLHLHFIYLYYPIVIVFCMFKTPIHAYILILMSHFSIQYSLFLAVVNQFYFYH